MTATASSIADLTRFLSDNYLVGSWARGSAPAPRKGNAAVHYGWDAIRSGLLESGKLVNIGSDGQTGMRSVTGVEARRFPVYMNTQVLMPGERTEAHRNLRTETRLVVEAHPGAVFVCESEGYPMERGDVVVSPPWTYHDHFNQASEPVIFVDGYDNGWNPNVNVNEKLPNGELYETITKPEGYSAGTYGHVRTISEGRPFPLPPMRYPWSETQKRLASLRDSEGAVDPYDGLLLMLTSPVDGGPTLPTMAWQVQLLAPRQTTLDHRHNSTSFYHVFEGEGITVIDGERLEWHKGDIFGVPPWTWHRHENTFSGDTLLFSVDDWPAMKALGFYMKQEAGR
jgi:gentisate 1,2-dioxygenase